MRANDQPIGVFDSGVGGLTVARAIQAQLPNESVVYFGDRARCPYGDQSPSDVVRYAIEISQFLVQASVKCIVIACNTATAAALPTLQSMLTVPIIGVINPGAKAAVDTTKNGRIGVIGTSVTIESHAYQKAIRALEPGAVVLEQACPAFVPLVEAGLFDGPRVEQLVKSALEPFRDTDVDTLVLGCTHYPLLAGVIRRVVGPLVSVISSADATALAVNELLYTRGIERTAPGPGAQHYYTTGDGSKMRLALANWFQAPVAADTVTQVTLPLLEEVALKSAIH